MGATVRPLHQRRAHFRLPSAESPVPFGGGHDPEYVPEVFGKRAITSAGIRHFQRNLIEAAMHVEPLNRPRALYMADLIDVEEFERVLRASSGCLTEPRNPVA
jgi:hypothetical protein